MYVLSSFGLPSWLLPESAPIDKHIISSSKTRAISLIFKPTLQVLTARLQYSPVLQIWIICCKLQLHRTKTKLYIFPSLQSSTPTSVNSCVFVPDTKVETREACFGQLYLHRQSITKSHDSSFAVTHKFATTFSFQCQYPAPGPCGFKPDSGQSLWSVFTGSGLSSLQFNLKHLLNFQ